MTAITSKPDHGAPIGDFNNEPVLSSDQMQAFMDDIENRINNPTLDCLDIYDNTGGQLIGTAVTVNLDTVRKFVGPSLSLSADEIICNISGIYQVIFRVSCFLSSGTMAVFRVFLEQDLLSGGVFAEIDGSSCFSSGRIVGSEPTTATASIIWDAESTDKLRLRAQEFDGTEDFTTKVDGSGMTIVKIG